MTLEDPLRIQEAMCGKGNAFKTSRPSTSFLRVGASKNLGAFSSSNLLQLHFISRAKKDGELVLLLEKGDFSAGQHVQKVFADFLAGIAKRRALKQSD